jgi:hypothetical protein
MTVSIQRGANPQADPRPANPNPNRMNSMNADARTNIEKAVSRGRTGRAAGRCLLALCLLGSVLSAQAWNGLEHMMVAKIAYDRLNPHARQKVDWASGQITLLGEHYNEINMATWADGIKHIKGDPFSAHYNNWHFIDLGLEPGDPDPLKNPPPLTVKNGDIVTALNHCEAVMTGKSDPLIPNEAVAIALMVHLMGDLHQPLHCTTDYYPNQPAGQFKTDIGGNNVAVTNMVDPYPNFHALWDGILEGSYDLKQNAFVVPDEAKPFEVTATTPLLVSKVDEVVKANTIGPGDLAGDYASWAAETHALGVTAYKSLGQDYTKAVDNRLGGLRGLCPRRRPAPGSPCRAPAGGGAQPDLSVASPPGAGPRPLGGRRIPAAPAAGPCPARSDVGPAALHAQVQDLDEKSAAQLEPLVGGDVRADQLGQGALLCDGAVPRRPGDLADPRSLVAAKRAHVHLAVRGGSLESKILVGGVPADEAGDMVGLRLPVEPRLLAAHARPGVAPRVA